MMPQGDRFAAALCIASQHGWWRNWSLSRQPRLAFVWYLLVPALLALGMKAPARLFGGEPLPRGVLADWARWCRSPHYICDEQGRALRPFNDRVRAVMRLLSFSDDPDFGPAHGVDRLADYYPQALRSDIDAINQRIYETVNNGVYRCGFATSQEAYEEAFAQLFETLDFLEGRLSTQRYLCGKTVTEADWRLFPTLIRFDAVYVGHFKCNQRRIDDYPNLSNYTRELYQWPGVSDTVAIDQYKRHYYGSHKSINPTGIVPVGPALAFERTHDRGRFG